MSDQKVTIVIDDQPLEVDQGSMIIEAADDAGIHIPRFCYHKKLSIAANCRMCLVDVDGARKPLPACATPITDGMKVYTKSKKALTYQKSVMEFLLINHPLDCPICDQGGECELQDNAMGYGSDKSEYTQAKHVTDDHDIGPLISTDLTRCIKCTRCVRFGTEIAGIRELGMIGRGEESEISTFLHQAVESEMSGNVIDICPVGALTSKPFRYRARAWEMTQHAAISPHDCVGSNLYVHTRRGEAMRVVPKENEQLNEVWLSDRDRFSYQGLHSESRAKFPMIKRDGEWEVVEWTEAFDYITKKLQAIIDKHGAKTVGALASPNQSCEEYYLLQKLLRGLGSHNIDYRLRQADFRAVDSQPYGIDCDLPYIEDSDAILSIAGDIRRQQPLIHHRIRKASRMGTAVFSINSKHYDMRIRNLDRTMVNLDEIPLKLAEIAKALLDTHADRLDEQRRAQATALLKDVTVSKGMQKVANALSHAERPVVLVGTVGIDHPNASTVLSLSTLIKRLANAKGGELPQGANNQGAWLAGARPAYKPGHHKLEQAGLNAQQMLTQHDALKACFLLGCEPELDSSYGQRAYDTLNECELVVALSPFHGDGLDDYADIILPVASFTETGGSYVNVHGLWQAVSGICPPPEQARPAWKVLRVLGNFFNLDGFGFNSVQDVADELAQKLAGMAQPERHIDLPASLPKTQQGLKRLGSSAMYAGDMLTRRAEALQNMQQKIEPAAIRLCPALASALNLDDGCHALVQQNNSSSSVTLPVVIDESLADKMVLIPTGLRETANLGSAFDSISILRV